MCLKLPGLQSSAKRNCIACGCVADLFCGRCNVTPYCSEQCQRRDWIARHKSVCHNLMRLQTSGRTSVAEPAEEIAIEPVIPAPAPLRQPRSPNHSQPLRDQAPVGKGYNKERGPSDQHRDRGQVNNNNKAHFVPPNHHPQQPVRNQRVPNNRFNNNNQDNRLPQRNNQQNNANKSQDNEEWGNTAPNAPESIPAPKPVEAPMPAIPPPEPKVEEPKPQAKTETFKNNRMAANLTPPIVKPVGKQLVPSHYLIEKLAIGETFVVSVDSYASECATDQHGFVCLAINAEYQDHYNMLMEDIFDSEVAYKPQPGETFAYLNESDIGWYRARCLSDTRCALLDSGKIEPLAGNCRKLQQKYHSIPEFCCVLSGKLELSMSLTCTILMKAGDGFKVSIESSDGEDLGEGTVTRWLPKVEQAKPIRQTPKIETQPAPKPEKPSPVPETKIAPQLRQPKSNTGPKQESTPVSKQESRPMAKQESQTITRQESQPMARQQTQNQPIAKPVIPEVTRPAIVNSRQYYLLHATSLARVCVRPCDAAHEFDSVLGDVLLYAMQKGKPLTEPPQQGQLVLSKFEDAYYRALVKRTKAVSNKYMVEYVEYGNEEIVTLENLLHCPPEFDLTSRPAQASIVSLSTAVTQLSPSAVEYIDSVKEEVELIATIPDGQKTAPSGSSVQLSIAKNKESVNRKLEDMCMPEWKKLEDAGKDVLESKVILFADIKTNPLPTDRQFILEVTDFSNIQNGVLCGFEKGTQLADYIYGPLTEKINEYANSELCREPYLPMVEELCIAKLPPFPQWFRAVVVEHTPGAATAAVLFLDYGNLEEAVPVAHLRKCMPEFCESPALAATADIKNWPQPASDEQTMSGLEYLNVDEESGRGQLAVSRCQSVGDEHSYEIEVPSLIAAVNASRAARNM